MKVSAQIEYVHKRETVSDVYEYTVSLSYLLKQQLVFVIQEIFNISTVINNYYVRNSTVQDPTSTTYVLSELCSFYLLDP